MTSFLLYLYTESPMHAGAADSSGVLDLPIQREATTGYPVVWGQSLKGALRQAAYEAGWGDLLLEVFGADVASAEGAGGDRAAGLLTVGDAQLVALPVPTVQRTFAWATSRLALSRLARKYARVALTDAAVPPVPSVGREHALSGNEAWQGRRAGVVGPYLLPLTVAAPADNGDGGEAANPVEAWGRLLARDAIGADAHLAPFAAKISEDLLVVGEDVMPGLLRECTEFTVRVQLDPDTKTVANGPFTSEYLPAETVLAAVLTLRDGADPELNTDLLRQLLCSGADYTGSNTMRIGGDETIGKGVAWTRLLGGPA